MQKLPLIILSILSLPTIGFILLEIMQRIWPYKYVEHCARTFSSPLCHCGMLATDKMAGRDYCDKHMPFE